MPTEVLFGFLGLVFGALIGFGGDFYINNRRMKFEAYKDTKAILTSMYSKLVEQHSEVQKSRIDSKEDTPKNRIINLKQYHWHVMEIYKEFRIYFGDLKAYELESALYQYFYELSLDNQELTDEDYFIAYQAIKDAYGLMISEVKLGLVSVNFIKKADRKLKQNKLAEYDKYSNRMIESIEGKMDLTDIDKHKQNKKPDLKKAVDVLIERYQAFENEYKQKMKK